MKAFWKSLGTMAFWGSWPLIYLYLRFNTRVRVLVTHRNKILLVKNWLGASEWSLPGGGIKRHENPVQAAARELAEETGIKIDPQLLKQLDKNQVKVHGLNFTYIGFWINLANLPKLSKPRGYHLDVTENRWVNKAELASMRVAADARAIIHDWFTS